MYAGVTDPKTTGMSGISSRSRLAQGVLTPLNQSCQAPTSACLFGLSAWVWSDERADTATNDDTMRTR